MVRRFGVLLLLLPSLIAGRPAQSQEKAVALDLKGLVAGKGGTIPAEATLEWVENAKGRPALRIRSKKDDSNFLGFAFRVVDAQTHDAVYFRPFNFRAADPEQKAHAVQYISHPKYRWDVLRNDRPGQYQKPIVPALDGDAWFHARLVIEKPTVHVYVNDGKEPSLVVEELSDRKGGGVGLWVGPEQGGYIANLKITPAK